MKKILITVILIVLFSLQAHAQIQTSDFQTQNIDTTGNVGRYSSLALTSDLNSVITYFDTTNQTLKVCNGIYNFFNCGVVDTSITKGTSSVVYQDSNINIAYYDLTNEDLKFGTGNLGNFTTEIVNNGSGGPVYGDYPSLAYGTDGNYHISYFENTMNSSLWYSEGTFGNWTNTQVEDVNTFSGAYTSIAYGADGNVHISHIEGATQDGLRYCEGANSAWKCERIEADNGSLTTSLVYGSDGNVHIAHDNGALRYCNGSFGNWTCFTVSAGSQTTMSMQEYLDGNYLISTQTSNNLYLCNGNDSTWTCTLIDNLQSGVGQYSSLGVSGSKIFISAYNTNADDLRYSTNWFLYSNFSYSLSNTYLDPENGVSSITVTLTDLSKSVGGGSVNSWSWLRNGVQFSTSQNTTDNITVAGDYNYTLIVGDTNGSFAQLDQNISIYQAPQNIDITLTRNYFVNNADVNFMVTSSSPINYVVWGFPNDANQMGININKVYTQGALNQVCVIVNTTGDLNKLYCENFTSTRFLVKTPKDEDTAASLTPFNISTSIPQQVYNSQATDLNVFTFFQDSNIFSITVDFNSNYYPRTYTYSLGTTDTFFELQPYLDLVTDSALVTITVIDGLTNNPLENYWIDMYIDINSVSTLAESKQTDGAGVGIFSMLVGQFYSARLYEPDRTYIDTKIISPSSTSYIWKINIQEIDINVSSKVFTVDFEPSDTIITYNTGDANKVFAFNIQSEASQTSSNVNINVDGVQIYDANYMTDGNKSIDLNLSSYSNNSVITVKVIITNPVRSETFTKVYIFKNTTDFDFILAMRNSVNLFGEFGAILISIFLSLMITGFVSYFVGFDTTVLGIVLMLSIGLFVFVGWFPLKIYLLGSIGFFGITILRGTFK